MGDDTRNIINQDNSIPGMLLKLFVPAILSIIGYAAIHISNSLDELTRQSYIMQGQIGVISSQNVDVVTRVTKAEASIDLSNRNVSRIDSRLSAVEAKRRP
jgi:hypothetical protein